MADPTTTRNDELVCPFCRYSLRGMPGNSVRCPECGSSLNKSRLRELYAREWSEIGTYKLLWWPVGWAALGLLLSLIIVGLFMDVNGSLMDRILPVVIGASLAMMPWVVVLRSVWRLYGRLEGVWLSLLVHLNVIAYSAGIIGLLMCGVTLLRSFMKANWVSVAQSLIAVPVALALIVATYLVDRFIGVRCLRRQADLTGAIGGEEFGQGEDE